MLPLTFQIQVASNTSYKKVVTNLTGQEVESWEDNEKTLDELIARVEKTIALLQSRLTPSRVEGVDDRLVDMNLGKVRVIKVPASTFCPRPRPS